MQHLHEADANRTAANSNAEDTGKILPDEQLYKYLASFKVEKLSDELRELIRGRIARCYDPRADQNYSSVDWAGALDVYMKAYAKQGLTKWSRAVIYDMPHVWGEHWWTKFFPHHWIAAIVPDIEAKASSHCLEFDYTAKEPKSDPAGCLFFKKSFEPTQALTRCIEGALVQSVNWRARDQIMRAHGPLHMADLKLSIVRTSTRKIEVLKDIISAWHASWNWRKEAVIVRFNQTTACSYVFFGTPECPQDSSLVRVVAKCGVGVSHAEVQCERRIRGDDASLSDLLLGRSIVPLGEVACESGDLSAAMPELDNAIALLEPGSCGPQEQAARAVAAGAVALLSSDKIQNDPKVPAFTLSGADSAGNLAALLRSAQGHEEQKGGKAALRVHRYLPRVPREAEPIPEFAEEVRIWKEARELEHVALLSAQERVYELVKEVSKVDLSPWYSTGARRAIVKAMRASITQPALSRVAALDPEAEQAILACYHLVPAKAEDKPKPRKVALVKREAPEDLPVPLAVAVPEEAGLVHEASRCLPLMWDKVEVPGPPYPQVWEASGSFPGDNLREVDELKVHPVCSRLGLALNHREMFGAPYPNPDEWEPGYHFRLSTAAVAVKTGSPRWIANNFLGYCLKPDHAVCTSFAVCWAALTRHVTRHIHAFCDERARPFPEMPILDE